MTCTCGDSDVTTRDSRCFTCPEGTFVETGKCVDCGGARRCINDKSHLLCEDGGIPQNSECKDVNVLNVQTVVNNHVVRCYGGSFASGETCGECPESCLSCANDSSCSVCVEGTSLTADGTCGASENMETQTHKGVVACQDAFFLTDNTCASCANRFSSVCRECSLCDVEKCVLCDGDVVFENGAWRASELCADADGAVCHACVDGATPFNATDCVPDGGCSVYVDGRCVACKQGLVPQADGMCRESEDCITHHDGVCLQCANGLYADENGVCRRLTHPQTHTQHAMVRAQHVH